MFVRCTCVLVAVAAFSMNLQARVEAQADADPHKHPAELSMMDTVGPSVSIVAVQAPPAASQNNITRDDSGWWLAFTVYKPGARNSDRIYFRDLKTGKTYEIRGIPLPHRPFSDLAWRGKGLLVFDRWSQPHFGIHYEVDAAKRRLVVAYGFPDELSEN